MKAKGKVVARPTADVVVGYLRPNHVEGNFFESFIELMTWDMTHDRRLSHRIGVRVSSGGLVEGRNQVAAMFLDGPGDWLLFIDSDMGFAPDSLDALLAVADPVKRPLVGGLCFAWKETRQDDLAGFRCVSRPTILDWVTVDGVETFSGRLEVPDNEVTRCAATGMAFVLIHRSVFTTIGPGDWFDRIKGSDGKWIGEDVSFCVRAGAAGIPVHVHTGVPTNHQKTLWVGPEDWVRDSHDLT
jgi:glycosyltransferase involved in cell wall biosynthesis